MNNELVELYNEVIFEHSKNPRNFCILANYNHNFQGANPFRGDAIDLYLNTENQRIKDISFQGQGCSICIASASLMTDFLKGLSYAEAQAALNTFKNHFLLSSSNCNCELSSNLEAFQAFSIIKKFPVRVKCATLAWNILGNLLGK